MSLPQIRAVYVKELRSLLRDRHIFLYSVALPAFLYPLLLFGSLQVIAYVRGVQERRLSRLEVHDAELEGAAAAALERALAGHGGIAILAAPAAPEAAPAEERWRERLAAGEVDGILVARSGAGSAGRTSEPAPLAAEIHYSSARDGSAAAKRRTEEALESLRRAKLLEAARQAGAEDEILAPLMIVETSLSTPEERANRIASLLLPVLMMVMTAFGAFYPALDATAGEKERGTLETTLLAPVGRQIVVAGKYLAVTTVALLSFSLNFASLGFTLSHLGSQLAVEGFRVGFGALLVIAAAAVLLAAFLGALMMLLAFLARSFKEGQAYVAPIYLLILVPLAVSARPEIHLTPRLALVPMVNTVLLFRDSLAGRFDPLAIGLTLASNAACVFFALLLAARLLGRERIATGSEVSLRRALRMALGRGPRGETEVLP
jgi:sodium transport system permease protein